MQWNSMVFQFVAYRNHLNIIFFLHCKQKNSKIRAWKKTKYLFWCRAKTSAHVWKNSNKNQLYYLNMFFSFAWHLCSTVPTSKHNHHSLDICVFPLRKLVLNGTCVYSQSCVSVETIRFMYLLILMYNMFIGTIISVSWTWIYFAGWRITFSLRFSSSNVIALWYKCSVYLKSHRDSQCQ